MSGRVDTIGVGDSEASRPIIATPVVPSGPNTFTITWVPGRDVMRAICFCGAELVGDDPLDLWLWVMGHPDGH